MCAPVNPQLVSVELNYISSAPVLVYFLLLIYLKNLFCFQIF